MNLLESAVWLQRDAAVCRFSSRKVNGVPAFARIDTPPEMVSPTQFAVT